MELRERLNVMEQRRDIFDDFRAGRTDSRPEVMLGILLLGTSFITGILVGLAIG
jgi:hypothetical protein